MMQYKVVKLKVKIFLQNQGQIIAKDEN